MSLKQSTPTEQNSRSRHLRGLQFAIMNLRGPTARSVLAVTTTWIQIFSKAESEDIYWVLCWSVLRQDFLQCPQGRFSARTLILCWLTLLTPVCNSIDWVQCNLTSESRLCWPSQRKKWALSNAGYDFGLFTASAWHWVKRAVWEMLPRCLPVEPFPHPTHKHHYDH